MNIVRLFNSTREDQEEYFQCGMAALLKAKKTFDPSKAQFSTYINSPVKWAIYNKFRTNRKIKKNEIQIENLDAIFTNNKNIVDSDEIQTRFDLDILSKTERFIIEQKFFYNKSFKEISKDLKKHRNTIYKIYKRSIGKLANSV